MNGEQKTKGEYIKFTVNRTDQRDLAPFGDRQNAEYLVLDLTYDKYAIEGLKAYAQAVRQEYPLFADDLDKRIAQMDSKAGGPGFKPCSICGSTSLRCGCD